MDESHEEETVKCVEGEEFQVSGVMPGGEWGRVEVSRTSGTVSS